jgi:hypothetical protein
LGASGFPLEGGLAHSFPTSGKKSFSWPAQSGILRTFQRLSKNTKAYIYASTGLSSVNEKNLYYLDTFSCYLIILIITGCWQFNYLQDFHL